MSDNLIISLGLSTQSDLVTAVLAHLLNFMLHYENADWQEVSRIMTVLNIDVKPVSTAYIDALVWYRDMFL